MGAGPYDTTRKNKVGDAYLFGGIFDPRVNPTAAPPGGLFIWVSRETGKPIGLLRKLDNGETTNWILIAQQILINGQPVDAGSIDFNFQGTGVDVVFQPDGVVDIIIAGTAIEKEEIFVMNPAETFNFKGVGVLVTQNGSDPTQVDVEIPGFPDGTTPFDDKTYRIEPRVLRADGNASNTEFEGFNVADLNSGGISNFLITIPMINYQAGDNLNIEFNYISENQGGQRGVDTQLSIGIFQLGDDVDNIVELISSDLYNVPNQQGITYQRSFSFTAAELGNLPDGNYFVKTTLTRTANSPQDKYNKNLHFFAGFAKWSQP